MNTSLSLILFFLIYQTYCKEIQIHSKLNERPIVGVLSSETDHSIYPIVNYTSYIAASYVTNLEASGARVVPIMIGKDRSYYEKLLRKLNGVLFPGGNAPFDKPNGFADAGQHIFEITKEFNDAGEHFPLFGVCLGFELIVVLAAGREKKNVLTSCNSQMKNLALDFSGDFRKSKMFSSSPEHVIDLFKNKDLTVNNHDFCVTDHTLRSFNLTEDWDPLSYSFDNNGLKFVSSIENKRYPIFGTQFHPEKVAYEWISNKIVHSRNAILANRYFMDFFVSESRMSLHKFSSTDEENEHLIYNYNPIFTGKDMGYFEQTYFFH